MTHENLTFAVIKLMKADDDIVSHDSITKKYLKGQATLTLIRMDHGHSP